MKFYPLKTTFVSRCDTKATARRKTYRQIFFLLGKFYFSFVSKIYLMNVTKSPLSLETEN